MSQATFKGGSLQSAKMVNANLQYTEFFDTVMIGADLSNSNIYSAVFDGVNLTNASLSGVYGADHMFVDVTWSNTTCPDGTNSDTNANCGFYYIVKRQFCVCVDCRSALLAPLSRRVFLLKRGILLAVIYLQ